MNIDDMISMMQGGQQQQSCLTRKPTQEELDKFIDRCKERDETLYSLFQAINFKLERQPHSIPEGEILPKVLTRIKERVEGGEV
ncbi:hypothetical protein VPHG_00190 [Vibrio phage 11895-B1]|uniref:hypothetical protein n=1 Tax=Vibrio phage 11895-B1 TaxID=754075 RepID=UPI0002C0E518|nr:hypothetical protein VPHG_00190 [Vibrio phage 11895-B1]AGH32253.1 hypothetical protein VPHG_00190 [Vibrio phage 11895-B1]